MMSDVKSVLITGATGFVGRALVSYFCGQGEYRVTAMVRPGVVWEEASARVVRVSDITKVDATSFQGMGFDVVIHAAARVHVMKEVAKDSLAEFRAVNVVGTQKLLNAVPMKKGCQFIFISSLKVLGDRSQSGAKFSHLSEYNPADPYAKSKVEAEQLLLGRAELGEFDLTIIRPPLIYGHGVAGNFASLAKVVRSGIPLPLGLMSGNKRSMIGIDNLISVVERCVETRRARNALFLVSDDFDVSTLELFQSIRKAIGSYSPAIPVPLLICKLFATLLGRGSQLARLTESLAVDIEHTKQVLDWQPPKSFYDGILGACEDYARK
jgi:nucleoside-diphosphate-sugar epimerase